MSTLGFSANDCKQAFERCDRNKDGKLDFDDFVQLFTVAWAHRETRDALRDSFERDMSEVVAQACRPVDKPPPPMPGEEGIENAEPPVTTAFPFALVANSHRITKLVDACDPKIREKSLPPVNPSRRRVSIKRRYSQGTKLPSIDRDSRDAVAAYTNADPGQLPGASPGGRRRSTAKTTAYDGFMTS